MIENEGDPAIDYEECFNACLAHVEDLRAVLQRWQEVAVPLLKNAEFKSEWDNKTYYHERRDITMSGGQTERIAKLLADTDAALK